MEPMARIELATSPLPRECSATELHGQAPFLYNNNSAIIPKPSSASKSGAGEGNRTLVVSLEGFCSTIELHPHLAIDLDMNQPSLITRSTKAIFPLNQVCRRRDLKISDRLIWWRGKDSNLRRQSRQIYSLIPLATREPLQTKPLIVNAFD